MLAGAILKTSVVGIGLNVNQEQFRGLKQATSLKLETGRDLLLKPLLAGIFHSLEARYLQFRGGARSQLSKVYMDQVLGYDRTRPLRLDQGPAKHRAAGRFSDIPDACERVIPGASPE